jgi:hypothetical protein
MNFKAISNSVKTVFTICLGLIVLFFVTKWNGFIFIAGILAILGLAFKKIADKIDFIWMKLSWVLSLIFPPILLTIIFYFFLTPIAILSRIFGDKNPLNLKNTNTSLFKKVDKTFTKTSFEKPW